MRMLPLYKCVKKGPNPVLELLPITAIVDALCFDELNQHKWFVNGNGYARRKVFASGVTTNYSVHAEVMRLSGVEKPQDGFFTVDHISGDKLDNRICNLRWASRAQQGVNTKPKSNGLPRGVFKRGSKFVAQVTSRSSGLHLHLGTFSTPHEAGAVFARKWDELFPELIDYKRA
jgi:hypothetical protein